MSNYIVDGSDLTSVANAIRAKSGGSGQLAFPSGFVSEIGNIPSGGSSSDPLVIKDYVVPSNKWASADSYPNVLKTGGCIHYVFSLQSNSDTSYDRALLCFGTGTISSWNGGNNQIAGFLNVGKNSSATILYLRGVGNTSINFSNLADSNGKVDVKLYSNKMVNVNTGSEITYATAQQQFFTALAAKDYLSVGINQSIPLTGAVITYFGLEES